MWLFTDFWCTTSDRRWILIYWSDQYLDFLGLYAELPPVYKRQCWCSCLCLGVCPGLQDIWEMHIVQFAETAPFSEVVDVNLPFFLDSGEGESWTCPDLLVTPMAVYIFVNHLFISVRDYIWAFGIEAAWEERDSLYADVCVRSFSMTEVAFWYFPRVFDCFQCAVWNVQRLLKALLPG